MGIKNCDTVKKAIKELNELGIEFDFIDFKKESLKKETDTVGKNFGENFR